MSALAIGTANTTAMSLISGDGTPMIMVFSPQCQIPEDTAHQQWSEVNGKPVTNPTTNCISMIYDINGAAGPNKLGTDVRTLNSLFGYRLFPRTSITKEECLQEKGKGYGITNCYYEDDSWAGAMKKCHDIGMHLPDMQTLANIAGAVYGRTDIGPRTSILRDDYSTVYGPTHKYYNYTVREDGSFDCKGWFEHMDRYQLTEGNVICTPAGSSMPIPTSSAVRSLKGNLFWASEKYASTSTYAYTRRIFSDISYWGRYTRDTNFVPLCVAD